MPILLHARKRHVQPTMIGLLTLSPHTLAKFVGIPSCVPRPCETQPQVQLCSVSFPGARAFKTRGRVAAGRARQAEMRLVVAETRRAVVGERARSCGGKPWLSATNPGKPMTVERFTLHDQPTDGRTGKKVVLPEQQATTLLLSLRYRRVRLLRSFRLRASDL